jgi:5-methylcytosine-specific restriction endonuclease McrA
MTTTNRVFVLDKNKKPLMPCRPARARRLLSRSRAAVYRLNPFTIIIKDRTAEDCVLQEVYLKFDPGSKTTGIALVAKLKKGETLIWAANLVHRGHLIKEKMDKRRAVRRSRRTRKTRYRKARFKNRSRPSGWLAPSLRSRVLNVRSWCERIIKLCLISHIEVETARFDSQKMMNPEISGVLYQQGTLQGYEVREYLLEKWGRKCAYCNKTGVPLQIEHIHPKSKGGSHRVSNLTLGCVECNTDKGNKDISVYLAHDPKRLAIINANRKKPLKDAAAMNSIRYAIGDALKSFGLPVTFHSGAQTKMNRIKQNYPKDHWIDAACVGTTGVNVKIPDKFSPLYIKAMGRGNRQKCLMNSNGFPRTKLNKKTGKREPQKPRGPKRVYGFQTGDIVKGKVTRGKNKGIYIGRVTIRASGSFTLTTKQKGESIKVGVRWKNCILLQRADGYEYSQKQPEQ